MTAYRYRIAACTIAVALLMSFDRLQLPAAAHYQAPATPVPAASPALPLAAATAAAATPECSKPLDVLIIMDVTGSMGPALDTAKQRSGELMTALRAQVPDSQFGVASVADYPTITDPIDYPWRLEHAITSDIDAVQRALANVELHSGGDPPESYGRALYEAQDPWRTGWRVQARHMVIFWGDAPAHDPDPGSDGQLATRDDLRLSEVLATTNEYGIHIYSISFGETADFQRMAAATGGEFYQAQDAADLPALITNAVQRACASIVPPSLGQMLLRLTTVRGTINPWCLLPLLPLLLLPLLLWKRRQTRRAIRRGMPLPPLGSPPQPARLAPPPQPDRPPTPAAQPARVNYRPALVVGLGSAGRWTLTHLKQSLGHQHQVALLAVDLAATSTARAAESIALIEPDIQRGRRTVSLDDHEVCWLASNPGSLADDIRRRPTVYPTLHAWLDAVDEGTDHIRARLTFLAELSAMMPRLEEALTDLNRRRGVDVYIVAGLGEAVGVGVYLDLLQALHVAALRQGQAVALHGITYLPDTLEGVTQPNETTRAAAFAVWRTLDRMQTSFGQQPPSPLAFDAILLNAQGHAPTIDSKLLSTCALISADRPVCSLITTLPELGVYPQTADALSARLEQPAAARFDEHLSNINSRLSQAQPHVDRGLYSSFGTFTYRLQPHALIHELADRLLVQSVDYLLESVGPTDTQPLFSALLGAAAYDLYRHVASEAPPQQWDAETILGLLEPPDTRGQLALYLQDSWPRHARFELLRTGQRGGAALQRISTSYEQQYLGSATEPGQWKHHLAANAAVATTVFGDHLLRELTTILNTPAAGGLTRAQALVAAIDQRLAAVAAALAAAIEIRERDLPEQRAEAARAAETFATRQPSLLRRLLGHVTSRAEDQALDQQQARLRCELELLAAHAAQQALADMRAIAQQQSFQTTSEQLAHERRAAQQRLDADRARRLAQLDLGHVRHEWGMPHTDITRLRAYSDPQRPLPAADRDRRLVQTLRAYLDGEHVTRLCQQHPVSPTALVERIFWTWQPDHTPPVIQTQLLVDRRAAVAMDGDGLRDLAAALHSWVWELRLPDLLAAELDHPAAFGHQLTDERTSPSIRYLPTPQDQHEVHTFLLVPPAAEAAHSRWFEQAVHAQREAGSQMISHQLLAGGDPYRITYLSTYELIGALQPGALPAYDDLAQAYLRPGGQRIMVATNEALAAQFERQRHIIRQHLHPRLVDILTSRPRAELFARALLAGLIRPEARATPVRYVTYLNGGPPAPLGPPVHNGASHTLQAFRWFMLSADESLLHAIEQAVTQVLPTIDPATYDHWLMHGLPAQLRASKDSAEQDLANLLQAMLDPSFDN